ncbi:MAG: 30S ribosomal protein S7 [Methylacidiphilales bacterium]|nr:30S ribosomal protein S7 [Candidatus Methylacidiphilales bacterium]
MSRRHSAVTRKIKPDPVYQSLILSKFINMIMERGKKSIAEKILYGAMAIIESKGHQNPLKVVEQSLENVSPFVEVKSRRVGGASYQVPIEVRPSRKLSLAMRWVLDAAHNRKDKNMVQKLSSELLDAFENKGQAIKKREDTHRMAEANKAFAHFRW